MRWGLLGIGLLVMGLVALQVNTPGGERSAVRKAPEEEVEREKVTFATVVRQNLSKCPLLAWPNEAGIEQPIEYVKECEWLMARPEDLNNPAPLSFPLKHVAAFYRTLTVHNDDIDISVTAHTTKKLASTPSLHSLFDTHLIEWKQRYRGCRVCGYSCAIMMPPVGFSMEYPLKGSLRVVAAGGKLLAYDNPDPDMVTTARHQGWDIAPKEGGLPMEQCLKIVTAATFFFKRRMTPYHKNNIAHWLHDLLFPVFMTIHNHVGDVSAAEYFVVPDVDAGERSFAKYWAFSERNELLEKLMPLNRRITPEHNQCFTQAVFNCPKADTMEPIAPFQNWLVNSMKLSFQPLALPVPTIMVKVRCKGGSRYLENADEMLKIAEEEGFGVMASTNTPVFTQMNTLVGILQRTSVIVSLHGSEIAPMLFMPNGSVVIEIAPREYRYLDSWYISQAAAAGLHLLRLSPNQSSVSYKFNGRGKVCGASRHKHESRIHSNKGSPESSYRQIASSITVGRDMWRDVVRLSKQLLS